HPVTKKIRHVLAKGRAWFGEDGQAYRFNGTLQDISDQKQAEAIQKEAEARFKNVTNSFPTGLWLSDTEGKLTYLNKTLVD
ncbi:PAS domain-containing protein, partial [Salmonella enterica subsp. enterica serovar Typhimurium]|uniref:PAS domain-containing protein n=1 Tax=Salmonella enterica TaxID=28901 RepID=UPI0020A3937B